MRSNASNARRKARDQGGKSHYDQHKYDGSDPDTSERGDPPRGRPLTDNQER